MASTTTSISSATKAQYAGIYGRIRRRIAIIDGIQNELSVSPRRITEYLVERRPDLAKNTWILYRCAVRLVFQVAIDALGEKAGSAYLEALESLDAEAQTGAKRRGTATSSLKARVIGPGDLNKLHSYLLDHRTQPRALQLVAYILASSATGLRPCEWANTELLEDTDGTPARLRVRNAKAGHGRANGEYRTLQLEGLDCAQLSGVKAMVAIARYVSGEPGGYPAWQAKLRHYLARSSRAALGKRQKYPSLYTFRHQFAANAKAVFSQEEVAALMGHASASTAGRNYAKRRQAKGGVGVTPLRAEVRTVRTPDSASFKLIRQNARLR